MRNVRPRFVTSKVIDSKTVVIIALAITLALSLPGQRVFAHGTQKYVNGRWFNGQTFELKTVYVVDGAFRMEYDGKADSTIDLQGKFVIPPLAEAHNHHFGEEANYKQQLRTYLQQGIFYSKNTNNIAKLAVPVRRLVNNPESVDVVYANGGLTSRGGHPAQIYDMFAQHLPGWSPKDMEDQAYFIIDTERELEQKWPRIISDRPDFIKTYLEYSEEFERRKDDPSFYGKRGLDPKLLPIIVKKAHANDLRVVAHINTATDFANAVAAGVDEITHLPLEKLTQEQAKSAASRGVIVVTTTISHRPTGHVKNLDDVHRHNINLLRASGVRLAIGSDDNNHTVVNEGENLLRLGVFDSLTLLKLMTEATPQTIFPRRKIGYLKEGYEASFIALDGNPLEDFANIRKVSFRVKSGHALELVAEAPRKPSIGNAIIHTLMGSGTGAAIAEYRRLKREQADDYDFAEKELNDLGYYLLRHDRMADAIEIFKLNVEMYPQGFNAHDSLAEAYMRNNNRELAIRHYKRSLELNPRNVNAVEMLKKLEGAGN